MMSYEPKGNALTYSFINYKEEAHLCYNSFEAAIQFGLMISDTELECVKLT